MRSLLAGPPRGRTEEALARTFEEEGASVEEHAEVAERLAQKGAPKSS